MTIKVLICDDEEDLAVKCSDEIKAFNDDEISVDIAKIKPFQDAVTLLVKRQKAYRESTPLPEEHCLFDDYHILIVDYDLLYLDKHERMTGEGIARLARAFSTCGPIVILNQRPDVDFDLTLSGDTESFADLNIPDKHISSQSLWLSSTRAGFRPWHWPLLKQSALNFRKRVDSLDGELDTPIFSFFGFNPERAQRLSRTALAFLHPNIPTHKVTFRDFVLSSGNALDKRAADDLAGADAQLCLIAATRIHKWLERLVVGPQDVLVDLPHLVARYPFLLSGDHANVKDLNQTCDLQAEATGLIIDPARKHLFIKDYWLSRPVFWWSDIECDEEIQAELNKFDFPDEELFFREDFSDFGSEADSDEFVAAFHSTYDRRHISKAKEEGSKNYGPLVRLAM